MGGADDLCAGGLEVVVGHGGEFAGVVLDQHGVAGGDQSVNAGRSDADAALVVLQLPGNAEDHGIQRYQILMACDFA